MQFLFGPDNYLYIGHGDLHGESPIGDEFNDGQNRHVDRRFEE